MTVREFLIENNLVPNNLNSLDVGQYRIFPMNNFTIDILDLSSSKRKVQSFHLDVKIDGYVYNNFFTEMKQNIRNSKIEAFLV